MRALIRVTILGLLFCGCANPFGSHSDIPFIGVWGAEDVAVPLKTIAFLDKGRYYENDVQVGAYYVIDARSGASGAENLSFTDYSVRIDYTGGQTAMISLWALVNNDLEIRIFHVSGEGGPLGNYNRLHSGEGL